MSSFRHVCMLMGAPAVAASARPFAMQAEVEPVGLVLLQHRVEITAGLRASGAGATTPTTEKGYQLVAASKSDEEMRAFIFRLVDNEARWINDAASLSGLVPYYSGSETVQSLEALKHELRAAPWVVDGVGRTAALNEVGYTQVVERKSKAHMKAFARRILDRASKKSVDEGALTGLVPYFDGEISVQSFDALEQELLSASWAVNRDSTEALPDVSLLAQRKFWPFTGSDKKDPEADTSADTKLVKPIKLAAKSASCDEWCSGELFVKVEANVTVLKNLSSWGMKCAWAHCEGCSACNDVSDLMALPLEQVSKQMHASKDASCDDWCSSEAFTAVNQNQTSMKQFSWGMKCKWQNCGACSKCEAQEALLQEKEYAVLDETKTDEDSEEEVTSDDQEEKANADW